MQGPWDVIVCGGGTAGAAAAISAGRQGAKTLVVEQLGSLGGTQANGWVTPMMPNYIGDFKLSRGISIDITNEQNRLQPAGDMTHGDVWYDPTYLATVLDKLAEEAGVTCLFNAWISDVRRNGSRVEAVEVVSRGGKRWLEGKTFIDCTGDAELSYLAGAEVMGGNEEGVHQPMTLRFFMGNIDLDALREEGGQYLRLNSADYIEAGVGEAKDSVFAPLVMDAIAQGVLEEDDLGYFQFFNVNGRPRELAFNAPRISGLDPLDPFEMSRAYQVGRQKIYRIAEFMRRYIGGCKDAYVSGIAPLMGIRESRRVVGDYVLTEEDHQDCRKFEDAIARNRYPVDIHLKTGLDYRKFPEGEFHDIPYRSIVVKGFDNLWVAGRCLSATFVAQSAVRIQPVCRAMGEAAGAAAAICARKSLTARELSYDELSSLLDLSLPCMNPGSVPIK
jgi:hypothetical protein